MPGENVAAGVTFQLMCSCCRARGKGHGDVCVRVCFFFHGGCRCREKFEDRAWVRVTRETWMDDRSFGENIASLNGIVV